ncbi:hypothetical protein ACOME3_007967 [Neoechinorhynchus agilis]
MSVEVKLDALIKALNKIYERDEKIKELASAFDKDVGHLNFEFDQLHRIGANERSKELELCDLLDEKMPSIRARITRYAS